MPGTKTGGFRNRQMCQKWNIAHFAVDGRNLVHRSGEKLFGTSRIEHVNSFRPGLTLETIKREHGIIPGENSFFLVFGGQKGRQYTCSRKFSMKNKPKF